MTNEILEKVEETWKEAEFLFKTLFPRVPIHFNLKGRTAGKAHASYYTSDCKLRFNLDIAKHNKEVFLQRTVPHEVAHLVEWFLYKSVGHGPKWKMIMRKLGCEPIRCHSYDLSNVEIRARGKHHYKCGCNDHYLSSTRHNRVIRDGQIYWCKKCKKDLVKA